MTDTDHIALIREHLAWADVAPRSSDFSVFVRHTRWLLSRLEQSSPEVEKICAHFATTGERDYEMEQ